MRVHGIFNVSVRMPPESTSQWQAKRKGERSGEQRRAERRERKDDEVQSKEHKKKKRGGWKRQSEREKVMLYLTGQGSEEVKTQRRVAREWPQANGMECIDGASTDDAALT